jgi:hypothetical protein
MIDEARSKADADPRRASRYLLLDQDGDAGEECPGEERVFTPARCLERAAEGDVRLVALLFKSGSNARRAALVELISILKRNESTCGLTIVAFLPARHRLLIEALKRAGADFVQLLGEGAANSFCVGDALHCLGPEDRPEHHLSEICPHINYSDIDSHLELALCGAYRNRMVLGGPRLQSTCATAGHLACEYYLNPRLVA